MSAPRCEHCGFVIEDRRAARVRVRVYAFEDDRKLHEREGYLCGSCAEDFDVPLVSQ
jgi:hypothetical protein